MSILTKIWGPFTATFNDITSGTKAYSGLKRDAVAINEENVEARFEFEDGSAADCEEGRRVTIELTISDIVIADHDTVEGYAGDFTLLFTKPSKTLTFPGTAAQPNHVFVGMEDGKAKFKITANWPLGSTHANVMSFA